MIPSNLLQKSVQDRLEEVKRHSALQVVYDVDLQQDYSRSIISHDKSVLQAHLVSHYFVGVTALTIEVTNVNRRLSVFDRFFMFDKDTALTQSCTRCKQYNGCILLLK